MAKGIVPLDRITGSVFVVTYGRSGSTLLQKLLNSIDGYCIRGENGNAILSLARAWQRIKNERRLQEARDTTHPGAPWYGAELIDQKAYGRALAETFVQQILQPPAGTRVAGFKEIRWTSEPGALRISLDFLKQFFPGARFVFNTRDHHAVAKSKWWASRNDHDVLAQLQRAEQEFAAYQNANPERCLRLHYDDYSADHDALRSLYDFLGEPWDGPRVSSIMAEQLTH